MSSIEKPKIKFWNDPEKRGLLIQASLVIILGYIAWYFISNVAENLTKQGIASGFGFLDSTAGFAIIQSLIEYSESSSYGRAFLVGLVNTILVSSLGIIIATVLGFLIGIARLSKNWLVSTLASIYVEWMRNIPLLLQIFFWYFVVLRALPHPRQSMSFLESFFLNNRGIYSPAPQFTGSSTWLWTTLLFISIIGLGYRKWAKKKQDETGTQYPTWFPILAAMFLGPIIIFFILGQPITLSYPALKGFNFQGGFVIIPELAALLAALSTYTASFIAEIVRSGILAVHKGQREAADALGLKSSISTRLIIIPQALRVIIPPLTSQYLNLTKNSSLAAAIGYPDLVAVFSGTVLNQTGQAVEVLIITMTVYLIISLGISLIMNWYNKRLALAER